MSLNLSRAQKKVIFYIFFATLWYQQQEIYDMKQQQNNFVDDHVNDIRESL
jgi:hypothetical protein